jgi:hypothetical protein
MDFEEEIATLKLKLEELKNKRHTDYHKYLNLKSIENFITHYDRIKPDSKKSFVLENLNGFIDSFKDLYNPNLDDYLELYNLFIVPVGRLYSSKAGFTFVTRPKYYILYLVIGIIALLVLKLSFWINALLMLSAAIMVYTTIRALNSDKCWGVSY